MVRPTHRLSNGLLTRSLDRAGRYPPFNVTMIDDQKGRVLKLFGLIAGNNVTWCAHALIKSWSLLI